MIKSRCIESSSPGLIFYIFSFFGAPGRPPNPHRIWLATLISTPNSSAKVQTRPGFFWNMRPTTTRSSPSSRSWFACLPLVMVPTVEMASLSPSFSLTALANGLKGQPHLRNLEYFWRTHRLVSRAGLNLLFRMIATGADV